MTILSQASTRFNFIRFWNNHWTLYKSFNYFFLTFVDRIFARYLLLLFKLMKFFKVSLIYSNFKILRTSSIFYIFIFLYDNLLLKLKTSKDIVKQKKLIKNFYFIDLFTGIFRKQFITFSSLFNLFLLFDFFNIKKSFAIKIFVDRLDGFIKIKRGLIKSILYCVFLFNSFSLKLIFKSLKGNQQFLNWDFLIKYIQLFSIRKKLYSKIYRFPLGPLKEKTLVRFIYKNIPGNLSENHFNFLSYASFLFKSISQFFKIKSNFILKFINLRKNIRPVNLFSHLIAQRICLLGRPRDRRNKLTTSFFMPIFNYMREDKSIAGFRLMLAGRINRRGRAMWKKFNFKRIPRGIFKLGVEFASQRIKTINGILTIKVFLFRPIKKFLTEISYNDFFLFMPFLFINRSLFSQVLTNLKNTLFNVKDGITYKLKQKLNLKRRTKKMVKQLVKRSGFSLI